MPTASLKQQKSLHRLVFDYYLRTGEQLTEQEWLAQQQSKFNPYHDELGRFTSPPGVTVSWGQNGGPSTRPEPAPHRPKPYKQINSSQPQPLGKSPKNSDEALASAENFQSEFVRNAVVEGEHAETYFELNRRQAGLDSLREAARTKREPNIAADLAEAQRRLDADRQRLDARASEIDAQINEMLRAGLAPADFAIGAANVLSGEGELRDYLSVAGVVPIGAAIRKLEWVAKLPRALVSVDGVAKEIIQFGGPHWKVRLLPGYHSHHMPSKVVSPLREGEGPAIAMLPEDHRATLSYSRSAKARAHRRAQAELIEKGDFRGAAQMDIDDIRNQFPGRYDDEIEQVLIHMNSKGY